MNLIFNFIIFTFLFLLCFRFNIAQVKPFLSLGCLEFAGIFPYGSKEQKEQYNLDTLCKSLTSASIPFSQAENIITKICKKQKKE